MKIHWIPQQGDLVAVPDCLLYPMTRKYALVVDVSMNGIMVEILIDSTVQQVHKDEVLPMVDLCGRWIQLGR